jgi:hypothetical protein
LQPALGLRQHAEDAHHVCAIGEPVPPDYSMPACRLNHVLPLGFRRPDQHFYPAVLGTACFGRVIGYGLGLASALYSHAGSRDAALVTTLQPGGYTAQVSGVGNTTGIALVEVYEVTP